MEYRALVSELQNELVGIYSFTPDIIKQCNLSIELCRNLISDFKAQVKQDGFDTIESEIEFFKFLKQVPLENLIYHFELKSFEVHFPKTSVALQEKFIRKYQKKLDSYFSRNIDFVQYVEQGKTYLDDKYFTRKYFKEFNITHSKLYYRDPDFSTSHDILLAKLNVNKRLVGYLRERTTNLGKKYNPSLARNGSSLKWTSSRTDMTELAYSLKKNGSVNFGEASIKEIIGALERAFNFQVGDPYKNFSEIKIRKKSRTKFLDELSHGLLSAMEDDDI